MSVSHPHSSDAVGLGLNVEKALAEAMGADDNLEELAKLIRRQAEQIDIEDRARRGAELEVVGIMHSVDKWFDDGDPTLLENPTQRAVVARERALKAIESAHADMDKARTERDQFKKHVESQAVADAKGRIIVGPWIDAASIWDLIAELAQNEGESVTIVHPNADFGGPSYCVTYAYGFDDCECENFYGESYKECLQKAKEFRDRRNS